VRNSSLVERSCAENEPSFILAAEGTGKPQCCVFIDDAAMANLCLGVIGTGKRFCLAKKIQGYTHCGVSVHAKGIRKKNKAKVMVDAFYVLGGTIQHKGVAKPTAKTNPMILKRDAPRKYLCWPTYHHRMERFDHQRSNVHRGQLT